MDEREISRTEEQVRERKSKRKGKFLIAAVLALMVVGIGVIKIFYSFPKGYEDYTVQMEQYYVEYSEEYDYWDVITVEYPLLEGIDEAVQKQLNQLMYDTALDRVNYWHLKPSGEIKAFQEENFSVFASDVNCEVTYHSQYLLSVDYREYYTGNPLWLTNGTKRALTVDLLTGESYELDEILEINHDLIKLWDKSFSDERDIERGKEEEIELLLSWFLQTDEEMNAEYFCRPFFYITEEKEFVIGISLDPVLEKLYTDEPVNRSFYTKLNMDELEEFKKESEFWDKYEKSETVGEILPCEDKKENIWLGEGASVWEQY